MTKDSENKLVEVLIEIPKGSRNKYEFNKETGKIHFDRMLFSSMQYPSDYGFIIDTLAEDGDPLDALVLVWEPTFPGCQITCRPVGLFKMEDEKGIDHKILAVPIKDPIWNKITSLNEVPQHLLVEIEHFFKVYKELEEKKTKVYGWDNVSEAHRVIDESRRQFKSQ